MLLLLPVSLHMCGCGRPPQGVYTPAEPAASGAEVTQVRAGAQGANLIVIALDAARADHFGVYGYARDTTPHLDRFLAESIIFEDAHSQAPNTKASVSSLLTSQFPDTHGVVGMYVALPSELSVLPEVLRAQGFRTVCFSANPFLSSSFAFGRGFDEFHEVFRDVHLDVNQLGRVPAELVAARASDWFREHQDERFFAYLHFLEPHDPYEPPEPFLSRYVSEGESEADRLMAHYDGNLAYADSVVGSLLAEIEELGLMERSVIVFLADHGEAFGEHGYFGHTGSVYTETTRVPLAFRLPPASGIEAGRLSMMVSVVDVMPTALDVLGLPFPPTMQGRSLLALLARLPAEQPTYAVSRSRGCDETGGVERPEEVTYALTTSQYTLLLGGLGKRVEVYDRVRDPGQRNNIARLEEDVTRQLLRQFEAWGHTQRVRPVVLPGGEVLVAQEQMVTPEARTQEHLKALGYLK